MVLIKLLLISLIVVFIVDISGAIESLKSGIKWVLTKGKMNHSNYSLKPFDCSLCMTFWCCLLYLYLVGEFTLPYIAFTCLLATFTGLFKSAILLVEDVLIKIIQAIYENYID